MEQRCLPLTQAAEKVIESENKRRQSAKATYDRTPEDYMNNKYSSVDSVLSVMQAEECLKTCQRGRDVVAKALEQNLQEFYTNIQLCYKN